jgi:radical SAM superfamily enzyme YgiQ (UPF0313 family)
MGRRRGEPYIRTWQMEPLAPAVLAALTPDDVKIRFYDDRMESIPYDEPADLVAITVETYTARRSYQIATEYRKRGIPIVMGGFHATLLPDEVAMYADAVVVGEAEGLWPRVIDDFRTGRLLRRYSSPVRPPLGGYSPDRSIFAGKKYLPLALVETGRGCVHGCEFCSVQSVFRRSFEPRPVAEIVSEITLLGRKFIFFVDDNIVSDRERARELFQALIPLNIRWIGQAGIGAALDEEILRLLELSGCQGLLVGLESLNPETLAQMGKGFAGGGAYYDKALANMRRHRIRMYATFVLGYDGDTAKSVQQMLEYSLRNRFYLAAFNHITPFPGTPLYDRLEQEGRLIFDRWWLHEDYRYGMLPFIPVGTAPEELERFCVSARRRFFALPSRIRRGLDFTVNSRSPFMWANFFIINGLMSREVLQRRRYPLGDESFSGPLLRVAPGESKVLETARTMPATACPEAV